MRTAVALVLAVAAVAGLSSAATSATAVTDPRRLALQRADFPSGTTFEAELGLDDYLKTALVAAGTTGRAAQYVAASYSETAGLLHVSGVVMAVSGGDARKAYGAVRKARIAFVNRSGSRDWRTVSLPKFGNEQAARVSPAGSEGIGGLELIVRKNRVVWLLYVSLERRPRTPTTTELVGIAKRFAAKQQRRVGPR